MWSRRLRSLGRHAINGASRLAVRLYVCAVIFSLIVLKPFWRVRLARFRAEKLGHFVNETELAWSLLTLRPAKSMRRTVNVFVMPKPCCNEQIRLMYLRKAHKLPHIKAIDARCSLVGRLLLPVAQFVTYQAQKRGRLDSLFCGSPSPGGTGDWGWVFPRSKFLTMSHEEEHEGWMSLKRLGIPKDARFVCLHVRDSKYLKVSEVNRDTSYHDYRNPEPETYLPMIQDLLEQNLYVVRTGREVNKRFPIKHPRFVDYPFTGATSDFLDVFLYAKAHLFVAGGASGIDQIGYAFGTPGVTVDFIPFVPTQAISSFLCTPVLLRRINSRRLLPFSEMLKNRYHSSQQYSAHGLELVRNSPEEIRHTVQEALTEMAAKQRNPEQIEFWAWAEECGVFADLKNQPPGTVRCSPLIGNFFLSRYRQQLFA